MKWLTVFAVVGLLLVGCEEKRTLAESIPDDTVATLAPAVANVDTSLAAVEQACAGGSAEATDMLDTLSTLPHNPKESTWCPAFLAGGLTMAKGTAFGQRRIIDFHTHVDVEKIDLAVRIMDAAGLAGVVNLSGGRGDRLKETIEKSAQYPGRFVTFCVCDFSGIDEPDFGEKQVEELRRSKEAGAQGLKVHKGLGMRVRYEDGSIVPVDDPRLDPIWQAAGELGLPVLIHTADPPDFWLPVDESNPSYETLRARPNWSYYGTDIPPHRELLYQRDRVVARHPGTTFIYAHMGDAVNDLEYLGCELDKNPNLFLDTSARCNLMAREDPAVVRAFFLKYQDRLLFGTDAGGNFRSEEDVPAVVDFYERHWNFFDTAEEGLIPFTSTMRANGINLPSDVLAKFYWGNAQKLLAL